jgi:ribosome-binding factor A
MLHRAERLNKLLLKELGTILSKEVDVSGALITLTDIKISRDYTSAEANVSVIPSEKTDEAMQELARQKKQIQHLLLKKLRMRRPPDINFRADYGMEKAATIEKLLLDEESK